MTGGGVGVGAMHGQSVSTGQKTAYTIGVTGAASSGLTGTGTNSASTAVTNTLTSSGTDLTMSGSAAANTARTIHATSRTDNLLKSLLSSMWEEMFELALKKIAYTSLCCSAMAVFTHVQRHRMRSA